MADAPLIAPHWALVFLVVGATSLLTIGVPLRLVFGLSSASDQVFALEALGAGLCANLLLRRFARRKFVIAPGVRIPFWCFWSLLCGYVFLARPFE